MHGRVRQCTEFQGVHTHAHLTVFDISIKARVVCSSGLQVSLPHSRAQVSWERDTQHTWHRIKKVWQKKKKEEKKCATVCACYESRSVRGHREVAIQKLQRSVWLHHRLALWTFYFDTYEVYVLHFLVWLLWECLTGVICENGPRHIHTRKKKTEGPHITRVTANCCLS